MRAVIQRVRQSLVTVENQTVGNIGNGLLVFLGVAKQDGDRDADYLADKITNLRIFEDENGKMNRSLLETSGEMLVVSQFTLLGDCDVAVDRILIMDYLLSLPLLAYGKMMNLISLWTKY